MAQNIYDDPGFFAGYSQLPRSREGLDGAPEWPALRALLPDLSGREVTDLGCGFGWFARWARTAGAARVTGFDLSENMLARARAETPDPAISYHRADLETLELAPGSTDLVFSALAFHYVRDFSRLAATIRGALRPGGHLVCSIEHPIYMAPTAPGWSLQEGRRIWPLDRYLVEGARVTDWLAEGVVKYHRLLGTTLNTLIGHGLAIARVEEWQPSEAQIREAPELAAELERPMFLFIRARAAA